MIDHGQRQGAADQRQASGPAQWRATTSARSNNSRMPRSRMAMFGIVETHGAGRSRGFGGLKRGSSFGPIGEVSEHYEIDHQNARRAAATAALTS